MGRPIIQTVVVDDDRIQLEVISDFVNKTGFLSLQGAYDDPLTALENIILLRPDLILLDVEMPGLTGFELIKSLNNPPQIIIITGKKEYAAEAYELDVLDYLVKPVDEYPRFLKALIKARDNFVGAQAPKDSESIYVKEGSLLVNLKFNDILYFEAYGDYVRIATMAKTYTVYSTLSNIEKQLTEDFIKIHRSYIIHLGKVENIDQSNLQIGGKIIPISQSMRPKLMDRIKTL